MFEFASIALIACVIFFASIIHGLVGFGFAMILVPVCSFLFLDLKDIVPIVVVLSLVIDIVILFDSRKSIDVNKVKRLILFGLAGIPIGTYILLAVDANLLKAVVGIIVVGFAVLLLSGYKFDSKDERYTFAVGGSISGILNSSLSLGRLPIALLLSNHGWEKNQYRANATLYFMVLDVVTIIMFIWKGLIKSEMFDSIILSTPIVIIGLLIGIALSRKTCEILFRKIVLSILVTVGIFMTAVSVVKL